LFESFCGGVRPILSFCEGDPLAQLGMMLSTDHGFSDVKFADRFVAERSHEQAASVFLSPAFKGSRPSIGDTQFLDLHVFVLYAQCCGASATNMLFICAVNFLPTECL
jgi:hypothetical protein